MVSLLIILYKFCCTHNLNKSNFIVLIIKKKGIHLKFSMLCLHILKFLNVFNFFISAQHIGLSRKKILDVINYHPSLHYDHSTKSTQRIKGVKNAEPTLEHNIVTITMATSLPTNISVIINIIIIITFYLCTSHHWLNLYLTCYHHKHTYNDIPFTRILLSLSYTTG